MTKLSNWLEENLFFLKTGSRLKIANDGKPVDEVIIRYKDYYFSIMTDCETGDPTGYFGWTHGSPVTHVPIRDFYTAKREDP